MIPTVQDTPIDVSLIPRRASLTLEHGYKDTDVGQVVYSTIKSESEIGTGIEQRDLDIRLRRSAPGNRCRLEDITTRLQWRAAYQWTVASSCDRASAVSTSDAISSAEVRIKYFILAKLYSAILTSTPTANRRIPSSDIRLRRAMRVLWHRLRIKEQKKSNV